MFSFSVIIPSPHLLVMAISERFLPAGDIFRAILANESHWLQPVLVLSVHWWPTPASVGGYKSIEGSSFCARWMRGMFMCGSFPRPYRRGRVFIVAKLLLLNVETGLMWVGSTFSKHECLESHNCQRMISC